MFAFKRTSPPTQTEQRLLEEPRGDGGHVIVAGCEGCGQSFVLLYSPERMTEGDARRIFAARVMEDHCQPPLRHSDGGAKEPHRSGFSLAEPPTRAEMAELLARRIKFWIENLRSYLHFSELQIAIEDDRLRDEAFEVGQAVIDVFGDDAPTDMDVEILAERWGDGDPDAPGTPFSPTYVFPRYLRYSFISLATLIFESELRSLCDSLATDRAIPALEARLTGATLFREAKKFLQHHAGASLDPKVCGILDDMFKVRNCIAHVNGRIDLSRDKKHLENLAMQQGQWLSIDCGRMGLRLLDVKCGYCENITDNIASFFRSVFTASGYLAEAD